MSRQSDLVIAHNGAWKRQLNISTPRALSDMNAAMNAVRPEHVRREKNVRELFDCSQQFLTGKKLLNQLGRLNVEVQVDARQLGGLLYAACGVAAAPSGSNPYTHAITVLGKGVYQLPMFTFVVGFNDGVDPGMLFQSAVLNRLSLTAQGIDDIVCRTEWVGFAPVPNDSFTYPACTDNPGLNLFDGALSVNSEDVLTGADENHTTRSYEFFIDNGILTGDHAFPVASKNPKRLDRQSVRTWGLRWGVEGVEGDDLHQLMAPDGEVGTDVPFSLRVGSATNGATITCPHALLEEDNNQAQTFAGETNDSILQALLTPLMNAGVLPFSVSAVNTQSTQYGVTA
jgi:hypothetical protein